jgi:hypothetical protein
VPLDLATTDDVRPASAGPPRTIGRRLCTLALLIVVVLGALGVFGVHSRTTSTSANGYTVWVTYPQSARAGLDVPWRVRVHHDGGFPNDHLTLAVSTDYFRMFETQGFFPDADSTTTDGTLVYFTFNTPAGGNDFVVDYDAYIQPAAQIGKSAKVELIADGRLVATTSIRTWLVP